MSHVSEASQEEALQMQELPRHHHGVPGCRLAEAQRQLRPCNGHRDPREGPGEQILTDKAVICLDCSCDCGNCDFTCCNLTPEITKRFAKQVDKMSNSDRNAFYELKSSTAWYDKKPCLRNNVGQEDCLEELNIFFFNTRSSNLYLSIALINQSCSPNTKMGDFGWDSNEVDICELRAIKDISRGEEITTFYQRKLSRDVLETKAERQKTLIEDYGFQCRCEVCRGEIPD